jgi:hypothetical protein
VAEDLAPEVLPAVRVEPARAELPPATPRPAPAGVFRKRFAVAYLALAVVAGIGIGGTVLLIDRPSEDVGTAWSNWEPTGRTSSFTRQIADYVSGRYRLPSGNPLVGILAGPPQVQEVPVRHVAIQNDPEGASDDISIVNIDPDESVMYVLCGLGEQCSIAEGPPSEERHQLLRREALELSLYTFKYSDARSVIALLPPRLPQSEEEAASATALFFQRADFDEQLKRPLRRTLLSPIPSRVAEISSIEGPTIDRLTTPHLFQYEFTQAQEGSAVLILAPLAQ